MIDSYIKLKEFKDKNNKFFLFILILILLFIIMFSISKIPTYRSFNLIKTNDKNIIVCEKNCDDLISNNIFIRGKDKINYKILNINDDIYEIKLESNIKFNDYISVGVRSKKNSAISFLINIFKRRE